VERFHVRGFNEEGTTTTPFDMVVKNGMSRYHLCLDAVKYAERPAGQTQALTDHCTAMLARHEAYIREHLEDMPEVRDWTWTAL
jgi:xylulose-5-phosphate/fructose-6-phosphate phosphoketolase